VSVTVRQSRRSRVLINGCQVGDFPRNVMVKLGLILTGRDITGFESCWLDLFAVGELRDSWEKIDVDRAPAPLA
jgi:hypothetical protein